MKQLKILVIRRDNIGDLLCTTPLIDTLRAHFASARIEALVNSYNAPILVGNPALDAVHFYTKIKHRESGESALGVALNTLRLIWRLRRSRFDLIFLPGMATKNAEKYARWLRHAHTKVICMRDATRSQTGLVDELVDPAPYLAQHEIAKCQALLAPLGFSQEPGPMSVFPDAETCARTREHPAFSARGKGGRLIGLHISARKPSQQWSSENFIELAHALCRRDSAVRLVLFWSPGTSSNPRHPGDDEKAEIIVQGCRDLPLVALPTQQLPELISGLSLVDTLICSDGGAMHLAAALGKPIVCLFGDSSPENWHPWAVPYRLLQPDCRAVSAISPDQVLTAYQALMEEVLSETGTPTAEVAVIEGVREECLDRRLS
jgi:ADP-heptose:LPS heptosyltransferase